MKRHSWLIFALIIFLIAGALRLVALGAVPTGLYWDEIAMYVDVKSVLATGRDMHGRVWWQVIYPSYGDFKLSGLLWLEILSAKMLGLSEFSLRLPSVLAGLGTGLVSIWLTLIFYQPRKKEAFIGLITASVLLFSPWSFLFSRTAFEGHVAQFWLGLSVCFLLTSWNKPVRSILAGFFGAVAIYTYFSVRFVWPFLLCGAALYLIATHKGHKKWATIVPSLLIATVVPLLTSFMLLIPALISPLYNDMNTFRLGTESVLESESVVIQQNIFREKAGNTFIDRMFFHRYWFIGSKLAQNYADHLDLRYLFFTGDPNLRHGTGQHGLFVWPLLPFLILGLYYLFKLKPAVGLFILGWWLASLLPASVPENTPHALRSLNALLPISFTISVGIFESIQKWRRSLLGTSGLLIYGMIIVVFTVEFFYYYFSVYAIDSSKAWQTGYKELAQALSKYQDKRIHIAVFDDRFYLWVMAYGTFSGQEFETWPTKQYQFESFENYNFNILFSQDKSQEFILAGKPDHLESILNDNEFTVVSTENVAVNGDTYFKVVSLKQ